MAEKKPTYEDARTIINLVKSHFQNQNPQLGYLFFRIDSIKANNKEGVWVVICSFLESFGSQKRINYKLRVNLNKGTFENLQTITEEQVKKELSEE